MSIPFRVRRAEWVAGSFLLLAVVALVASLVLLSRARGSFESTTSYHVTLDDGYGIAAGGRVQMLGIDIGRIEALEITDDNRVSARLEIRERFVARLREDSTARVSASLDLQGVLGGVGLTVSPGSPDAAPLPPDSAIAVVEPHSIADLLPAVKGDHLLGDVEVLIHNARTMSEQVADPDSPLQLALTQVTTLLTKIQDRESTVGRILHDDGEIYGRLLGTLDQVEGSLARLEKVLSRSDGLIRSADGMVDRGGELMVDASELIATSDQVVQGISPVLDTTDTAMKDLDDAVLAFGATTRELEAVIKALGPVVENMDEMVRDMDAVAKATMKVWPIRRHARKEQRKK